MTPAAFATCLIIAAQTYAVPPAVLVGIMRVEGGHVGQEVLNTNGTYDLGPMQVNTTWVPELARRWKVDQNTAYHWVRDDGCVNVDVAAWILKRNIDSTGYLVGGISHYHSATPGLGTSYARKVVAVMRRFGLIKDTPSPQGQSAPSVTLTKTE